MADLIILSGEHGNIMTTAKAITPSDEHAILTRQYLYDGRPSKKFRFLTNDFDSDVVVDGDMLHRGDFEVSTLSGWTDESVGGSIAETTVGAEVQAGTKALKATGVVGVGLEGAATREIQVRSGQRLTIIAWIRGATATGRVEVSCVQTGKYLTSGAVWQVSPVDVFTHATSTYTLKTLAFRMETIDLCQGMPEVTLRIKCYVTNEAGSATFDSLAVFPTVNLLGVFWHDIPPGISPVLASSPDNSAWTTEATLTPLRPTFYGYLSTPSANRYHRLRSQGNKRDAVSYGEVVLGYGEAMTRRPNLNSSFEQSYMQPLEEVVAGGGDVWAMTIGAELRRTFAMPFHFNNQTVMDEARREVFQRSQGSRWPLVIIPDSTKADVIHGRIDRSWKVARTFVSYYTDNDLTVAEDPFPVEVG